MADAGKFGKLRGVSGKFIQKNIQKNIFSHKLFANTVSRRGKRCRNLRASGGMKGWKREKGHKNQKEQTPLFSRFARFFTFSLPPPCSAERVRRGFWFLVLFCFLFAIIFLLNITRDLNFPCLCDFRCLISFPGS